MADLPPQATLLLSGQRVDSTGAAVELHWVLALTAKSVEPTAFGASRTCIAAEGDGESSIEVCIVHGSWNSTKWQLRVQEENSCSIRGGLLVYFDGLVQRESGSLLVQGSWHDNLGATGAFGLCAETDSSVHTTGLWLGMAKPHPDLAPFLIPTNPIRWAFSLHNEYCFGAGYFDDAADVPGKPVLFFTLVGRVEGDAVELTKTYEQVDGGQTDGMTVKYHGSLQRRHDGTWLEGTWQNEQGGSYGDWLCRQEPTWSSESYQLVLCSNCQAVISPGDLRYDCSVCQDPWSACEQCAGGRDLGEVHEHPLVPETMSETKRVDAKDCASLVVEALREFAPRPFIGHRERDDMFKYCSYREVERVARSLASGLEALGLQRGQHVLLEADVSANYFAAMLSCVMLRAVLVPISPVVDKDFVAHVTRCTEVKIAAMGAPYLLALVETLQNTGVEHVVEIPTERELASLKAGERSAAAWPWKISLCDLLCETSSDWVPNGELSKKDSPRAVLWTSGSTGNPKGAVFTDELMLPVGRGAAIWPFVRLDFEPYDPSLSLSLLQTVRWGGRRCIACGLDTLLQDFQLARPTHIGATPVLWNSLYQDFQVKVESALAAVPAALRDRTAAEQAAGEQVRSLLGNRVHVASAGGAPTAPEVLQFVKRFLKIDVADTYGSRETGGIAVDGKIHPGIEVRLRDLPELGYYNTDSPSRGEILVHSPMLIPGYFGDEGATSNAFIHLDGKRFYCTGDVGELRPGSDGEPRLSVIDRCAFFFKLSHGEWISPVKIEAVLERSSLIEQAFVLGVPSQPFAVAILVPSQQFQQLHQGASQRSHMEQHVRFWAANEHLRAIEIPQRVHIETNQWSVAQGGLTANLKKSRPWLMSKYRQTVQDLSEMPGSSASAVADSSDALDSEFLNMLRAVLPGRLPEQVFPQQLLGELGGDSLAAGRLIARFRAAGVELSMAALYDYPMAHLSDLLTSARSGAAPVARAAPINWERERELPADWPVQIPKENLHASLTGVLLTGATGFLGPMLLAELVQKRPPDCTIYCLVRGPDAQQRLKDSLKLCGVALESLTDQHAKVRVIPGDLSQPHLGLADSTYDELLACLAEVVHNGAVVNHLLPYSALRAVNVQGTLEVAKLAFSARASFTYISSVAALPREQLCAEEWLQPLSEEQMRELSGYGQTKAVTEQLLKRLADRGLRVCNIRAGDIGPDRKTGYFNPKDTTLALVRACALLGSAVLPTSFAMGWLPADAAAAAIIQLSDQATCCTTSTGGYVYHLIASSPNLEDVLRSLEGHSYHFKSVSIDTWRASLDEESAAVGAALPFLARIDFPPPGVIASQLPTTAARSVLGGLQLEAWAVSQQDLDLFASRWCSEGFLPEPLGGSR